MLEKLRFQGDPGINGYYTAPWGLSFPARGEAPFYVVAAGQCRLEIEGGPPLELGPRDLVLLPRGDAHTLRDAPGSRVVPSSSVVSRQGPGMTTLRWGGGGAETQLVGGSFQFDSPFSLPVLHALGRVIVVRADDPRRHEGINLLLSLFCYEGRSNQPGSRSATSGLLKLLFIQILRHALSQGHEQRSCAANPLVLLFDASLRPAAEAIHFEYRRSWTVAELADLAGMSRTTFAVRFQELTGTSPSAYLNHVRMLAAVDKLERTGATLEAIALEIGYGSEAAFSTAFKRALGIAPGAFRKQKRPAERSQAVNTSP